MEDVIILLQPTGTTTDAYGIDQVSACSERSVLCTVKSASRSEFYQAAIAGRYPELEVEIFFADYQGEPEAMYNGHVYSIIRTYRSSRSYETQMNYQDSDMITMTLERKIGR